MRRAGLLLGIALAVTAVHAEDAPPAPDTADTAEKPAPLVKGWTFDSTTSAGYRWVSVGGSTARYQSDVDLRQGGRLFLFSIDGLVDDPENSPLDKFHLEIDTPGDEPASYFTLTAANRKVWDLRADFSRTRWVYDDPQLWTTPVSEDRLLADPQSWNVVRTQGHVDLTIHTGDDMPTIRAGYRLYEREGSTSLSTVYVPEGDTFRLYAPVHSIANVGLLGTDFKIVGTSVSLTQEYRTIGRSFDATGPYVPGGPGLDPTDGVSLEGYDRRRDDHLWSPITTLRASRSFGENVDVEGAYLYSHTVLNEGDGTINSNVISGTPPVLDHGRTISGADGTLDTNVADLGGRWRLGHGFTLNANYRFNERSQEATYEQFAGAGGPYTVDSGYHVRWNSITTDLMYEPGHGLTLRAGMRYANRDAYLSEADESANTDYIGVIADARWKPRREVEFNVRYENVNIDDPLVSQGDPLSTPPIPSRQIALTATNRGSAGLRVTPVTWLTLQYQFIADSRTNDTFAGAAQSFGNSIGLSIAPWEALTFFAGYTRRDVTTQGNIVRAPLYDTYLALQDGSEDSVTSTLRWEFPLAGQHFATGWQFSWSHVDEQLLPTYEPGQSGGTPYLLSRIDGGAFLAFLHPWIEPSVEVRRIVYTEQATPNDDFDATIVALKFTKHFSR